MDFTLLSGVVRNRKSKARDFDFYEDDDEDFGTISSSNSTKSSSSKFSKILKFLLELKFINKFSLRIHQFFFQWDLVLHFILSLLSLVPYFFSYSSFNLFLPLSLWFFYHFLYLIPPIKVSNLILKILMGLKLTKFKNSLENFFSLKLLPVLSLSYLFVIISLYITGKLLQGPPLCFDSCSICLSRWDASIKIGEEGSEYYSKDMEGCGYANGRELLAYYTMVQISFLLYTLVLIAMAICLAWTISKEDREEHNSAVKWLEKSTPQAAQLRLTLLNESGGPPASSLRPEGGVIWVLIGLTASLSFFLLGWSHWKMLPLKLGFSYSFIIIFLNLLTICMTILILHLNFFGRILAIYTRNFKRVEYLTRTLKELNQYHTNTISSFDPTFNHQVPQGSTKTQINNYDKKLEIWWNCRNFILQDDLLLDYEIGGIAVSMTFLINVIVFFIILYQFYYERSLHILLESPGTYSSYACFYITSCMIKIFSIATKTFEEQRAHLTILENFCNKLVYKIHTEKEEYKKKRIFMLSSAPATVNSTFQTNSPISPPLLASNSSQNSQVPHALALSLPTPTVSDISQGPTANSTPLTPYLNLNNPSNQFDDNFDDNFDDGIFIEDSLPSTPVRRFGKSSAFQTNSGPVVTLPSSMINLPSSNLHSSPAGGSSSISNLESGVSNTLTGTPSNNTKKQDFIGVSAISDNISSLMSNFNTDNYSKTPQNYTMNTTASSSSSSSTAFDPYYSTLPESPSFLELINLLEASRSNTAELISQIRLYDPYPCVLGLPVMPMLFKVSKGAIFLLFFSIGFSIFYYSFLSNSSLNPSQIST